MSKLIVFFAALFFPALSSAHEVYVLDGTTIAEAMATDSRNPFLAYIGNEWSFIFWGLVSSVALSTILFASVFHLFEERTHRFLTYLKKFAQPLVRATVAITLSAFALYGYIYGPELPLEYVFGGGAFFVRTALALCAVAVLFGMYTRTAALVAISIYLSSIASLGSYAVSYIDHLGAYVLLLTLGAGAWSFDGKNDARFFPAPFLSLLHRLRPYVYPILRITFGTSIMFAAVYAKFLHSELAVQVVLEYDLTRFFPFDPLFVVLGAFIIEFLAGLMMMLGVAVRWTALFLAFWLTMGHIYTNEFWWVHIILYGVALAIFCHGYDRWSLEGRLLRRSDREPVL